MSWPPERLGRRRFLAGAGVLALSGCGFQPMYGTGSDFGTVAADLASINVAVIPDRTGQLLRAYLDVHPADAPARALLALVTAAKADD